MSGGHGSSGGAIRKLVIVFMLTGGLVLLHRFAVRTAGFDPTGMLAFGFVVLASYALGELVDRIKLPHLTGYIAAGLAMGPSVAHSLPEALRIPPFDQGILSESVLDQFLPLETLAIALIAFAAGGELRLGFLKSGLRSILGLLSGQAVAVLLLGSAFFLAVSGLIPQIAFPGLGELDFGGAVAIAAVVGAVSMATSPPVTMAVINGVGATGPFSRTVLAAVVLEDVLVVVVFSVLSTFAVQAIGGTGGGDLGTYLLQHIGGSIVAGIGLGVLTGGYLRLVGQELLIFLVAIVFVGSYVSSTLDLNPLLAFIVAGFVVGNFSAEGEHLIEEVERLSIPVYVVFFTLTGARLHLDALAEVAPFAIALVSLRAFAAWIGASTGARLAGADENVRKYGWLGFVSQAGVALSLASIVGSKLGEPGEAIATLLVACVALNEMIGPVVLKLGLGLAGEIKEPSGAAEGETEEEATETITEASVDAAREPEHWPLTRDGEPIWRTLEPSATPALDEVAEGLRADLLDLSRELIERPITRFREEGRTFVQEIRREFLRHHRRITVQALDETTELGATEALRLEKAALAERWRAAVLGRRTRLEKHWGLRIDPLMDEAEGLAERLPDAVVAPFEPESYESRERDGAGRRFARSVLRSRRWSRSAFGMAEPTRRVPIRSLGRYHFWGLLPGQLEAVADLRSEAEAHLAHRARQAFELVAKRYEDLADELAEADAHARPSVPAEPPLTEGTEPKGEEGSTAKASEAASEATARSELIEARLREIRAEADVVFGEVTEELERVADDLSDRTQRVLATRFEELRRDMLAIGGPDLPARKRASSRLYRRREETVRALKARTAAARETVAALYGRLALEIELMALEGRVRDVVEEHTTALGRDVRGRAHRQVVRVLEALRTAESSVNEALDEGGAGESLAATLRAQAQPVIHVAAEASKLAGQLRDQLSDERAVAQLLDALARTAQGLTDRYRIPAGAFDRSDRRIVPAAGTVEVPFREWVIVRIESHLNPRLVAVAREVAILVDPLAQALAELERRTAFNLELAVGEVSVVGEELVHPETRELVREMLLGNLQRQREVFEGYSESAAGWGEAARLKLRGTVLDGLTSLRASIVEGEVSRLRSQMVRDVRGRAIARGVGEIRAAIRKATSATWRAARERIGEARLIRLRRKLGLVPAPATTALDSASLAAPAAKAELPMVYRRLFSPQALEAGDILTAREDLLERARDQLEGRGRGLKTVAIVGPDGVGKGAFVHALMRGRRWPKVRELTLKAPASLDEVDALFDGQGEGHLVIISGLHWLSSLRPGGIAPLRRFVERVLADEGRTAFILRADSVVWRQSCELAPVRDAFAAIVELEPLGVSNLEAAIMARHNVSGHGLVFHESAAPEGRVEELVAQLTSKLSRPRESFFLALHAASGGLLRDALRLWLAAVEKVDEASDFVHLGPVDPPPILALRALDDARALTLYQVARQGWMDAEGLAFLKRVDTTTAAAELGALTTLGLLERRGAVHRVASHLRGSVQRLLRERGYLA